MSDIKLFRLTSTTAVEVPSQSAHKEEKLQKLIEGHLDVFFGVRLLASQYRTGKRDYGIIDTLGIDEDGSPVIIEYKRATNENVVTQGLYYLDWLTDQQEAFVLMVLKQLGQDAADSIEWAAPRLLCIAGDFHKYDKHAVQQIDRNIELIRYKLFDDDLLVLELVNATTAVHGGAGSGTALETDGPIRTTATENLLTADQDLLDRFEALKSFLLALGDDVQMKTLKHYFAFKRFRNFACVQVRPGAGTIVVLARLDPQSVTLKEDFSRDVRKIGRFGTGDLEIMLNSMADFEEAKPLLIKSYEA